MFRTTAVVLLLLVPAVAHADAGSSLPGIRTVWINYTFTVEQDYPEYDFYLLTTMQRTAVQVALSPSAPVRVLAGDTPPAWGLLFAVKKPLRPPSIDPWSIESWLRANEGRGVVRFPNQYDYIRFNGSLPFTDNRDQVEITYRVEIGPDGGRLVKVSENAGNLWFKRAWIFVGVMLAVGIIGLGLRSVRRACRPRIP